MSPLALFVVAALERGYLVEFNPAAGARVRCVVYTTITAHQSGYGEDPDEAARVVAAKVGIDIPEWS